MQVTVALGVLALVGAALARPQYNRGHGGASFTPAAAYRPAPSYSDVPRYNFNYAVRDNFGNDFGHQESRDGYDTKGSYFVQLPDGRVQHVNYYVNGDSGYVAEVTYQGEAQYPAYTPANGYGHPAPNYG